jgi:repressor of nif and glnA expression
MAQQSQRVKLDILKALLSVDGAAGASRITDHLLSAGSDLQPRTIRYYLLQMDREGLTRFVSRRRGREITDRGRAELANANVLEKVGFIGSKIDSLGYRMSFSLSTGQGTLITNVATIHKSNFLRALEDMKPVFSRRLGMGSRIAVAREGQTVGHYTVPADTVALGTVCSITVNGILLDEGIPVVSRFGGLMEIRDGKPIRFVELIEYQGTSIDPLEFFIKANMTRVRDCARSGTGLIGASFREIPAAAIEDVQRIRKEMEKYGLGGILAIGRPGQSLFDIPVTAGRAGLIVAGGMNPVAAIHESGTRITIQSMAGLDDFSKYRSFQEVRDRYPG